MKHGARPKTVRRSKVFTWNGKTLNNVGDILDAAVEAADAGKAHQFLAAYLAYDPQHAAGNLSYILGYIEPAERRNEVFAAFFPKP
jgi:hypothetical protein